MSVCIKSVLFVLILRIMTYWRRNLKKNSIQMQWNKACILIFSFLLYFCFCVLAFEFCGLQFFSIKYHVSSIFLFISGQHSQVRCCITAVVCGSCNLLILSWWGGGILSILFPFFSPYFFVIIQSSGFSWVSIWSWLILFRKIIFSFI